MVLGIARDSSGNMIGQFREDDENLNSMLASETAHYIWSPTIGIWSQFKPGACEHGRLIGASEVGAVYVRYDEHGYRTHHPRTVPFPVMKLAR